MKALLYLVLLVIKLTVSQYNEYFTSMNPSQIVVDTHSEGMFYVSNTQIAVLPPTDIILQRDLNVKCQIKSIGSNASKNYTVSSLLCPEPGLYDVYFIVNQTKFSLEVVYYDITPNTVTKVSRSTIFTNITYTLILDYNSNDLNPTDDFIIRSSGVVIKECEMLLGAYGVKQINVVVRCSEPDIYFIFIKGIRQVHYIHAINEQDEVEITPATIISIDKDELELYKKNTVRVTYQSNRQFFYTDVVIIDPKYYKPSLEFEAWYEDYFILRIVTKFEGDYTIYIKNIKQVKALKSISNENDSKMLSALSPSEAYYKTGALIPITMVFNDKYHIEINDIGLSYPYNECSLQFISRKKNEISFKAECKSTGNYRVFIGIIIQDLPFIIKKKIADSNSITSVIPDKLIPETLTEVNLVYDIEIDFVTLRLSNQYESAKKCEVIVMQYDKVNIKTQIKCKEVGEYYFQLNDSKQKRIEVLNYVIPSDIVTLIKPIELPMNIKTVLIFTLMKVIPLELQIIELKSIDENPTYCIIDTLNESQSMVFSVNALCSKPKVYYLFIFGVQQLLPIEVLLPLSSNSIESITPSRINKKIVYQIKFTYAYGTKPIENNLVILSQSNPQELCEIEMIESALTKFSLMVTCPSYSTYDVYIGQIKQGISLIVHDIPVQSTTATKIKAVNNDKITVGIDINIRVEFNDCIYFKENEIAFKTEFGPVRSCIIKSYVWNQIYAALTLNCPSSQSYRLLIKEVKQTLMIKPYQPMITSISPSLTKRNTRVTFTISLSPTEPISNLDWIIFVEHSSSLPEISLSPCEINVNRRVASCLLELSSNKYSVYYNDILQPFIVYTVNENKRNFNDSGNLFQANCMLIIIMFTFLI